jgi:hypothetical protein
MRRGSNQVAEQPVIVSLVDTSKSTIRMLFELWYTMRHEAHH